MTPEETLLDSGTAFHSDRHHEGRFSECFLWGCGAAKEAIAELRAEKERAATKDSLVECLFEFNTWDYHPFDEKYPWLKGLRQTQYEYTMFCFVANSVGRNDVLREDD